MEQNCRAAWRSYNYQHYVIIALQTPFNQEEEEDGGGGGDVDEDEQDDDGGDDDAKHLHNDHQGSKGDESANIYSWGPQKKKKKLFNYHHLSTNSHCVLACVSLSCLPVTL